MQWLFIDSNIITESETGYTIRLNSGTWQNPTDIMPDKTNISPSGQARLLRLGLEFAEQAACSKVTI